MKTNHFLVLALAATVGMGILNSCSKDDYHYDPNYQKELTMSQYTNNFVNTFGDVSNVKSWDFSTGEAVLATRATSGVTSTAVSGNIFGNVSVNTYSESTTYRADKNQKLLNQVTTKLKDGVKHTGDMAVLTAPNNSFTIYPLMACGAFEYDMYVKITEPDGTTHDPVKVFSKNWNVSDHYYMNGMQAYNYEKKQSMGQTKWEQSRTATNISTPGMTFEAPVGSTIQIYVQITDVNQYANKGTNVGDIFSTGTANSVIVASDLKASDITFPDDIKNTLSANAQIKLIGIEDTKLGSSLCDNDFNDLVVLLVGNPDVPQKLVIENDEYTTEVARPCKRYMIEDLGSTDDFDFNDLVVDVEAVDYETHHVTITNGVITEDKVTKNSTGQVAYIRAMGGTVDFTLKIGNETNGYTEWTKSTGTATDGSAFQIGNMYNTTDPNYDSESYLVKIPLKDNQWVPDSNNITVTVGGQDATDATTITFGEAGKAPLMIATDRDQEWAVERATATWIKDKMKQAQ